LGAAYVANANGADASYYNPANMVWNDDVSEFELALTYINLPKVKYKDNLSSSLDSDSKEEEFYMPTFHYVSPAVGNWRFGLSMVAPGGLSKRWDEAYTKAYAEEFSLKIIELNPTVAYKVNDKFSVGFGLRGVYSDGVVKSSGTVSRDMTGDSIDYGYNLAISYKPIDNLTFSSTYRSKVDLTIEGEADLYSGTTKAYSGGASVTIPLPASFTVATAYTMSKTTLEFVFERTYWSSYKDLDFNYDRSIGNLAPYFDDSKPKNWKDVNAYRIGVTHQYSDSLKLMAGFSIDKTPVPDETLGFELPDSDAYNYSAGLEYKVNKDMKVGLSYLYSDKEERSINERAVSSNPLTGINGTFSNSSAHLVTASLKYRF
jgi:long-chain fatty acid transport protein